MLVTHLKIKPSIKGYKMPYDNIITFKFDNM